jgi:hypothetical protein
MVPLREEMIFIKTTSKWKVLRGRRLYRRKMKRSRNRKFRNRRNYNNNLRRSILKDKLMIQIFYIS